MTSERSDARERELPEVSAFASERRLRVPWLALATAWVVLLCLFGPLSSSGIWDPPELEVVDLARRIAHGLLGADGLAIEGANNDVPTQGELGKGELPFTSVALGLAVFGLHEWAARLPLAIWGLVGVLASVVLVARLSDRRAAAFSALALATMPLYYLHARTILGDIVTMATLALAVSGLAIAAFDGPSIGKKPALFRISMLALGIGAAALGILARGLLIGLAIPGLAVGIGWLVARPHRAERRDKLGDVAGVVSLLLGIGGLVAGVISLRAAIETPSEFSRLFGTAIQKQRQLPTFDVVIQHLGHGLLPWSAFLPFALGRVLSSAPDDDVSPEERNVKQREIALRVVVLLTAAFAFAAYGLLAPYTGQLPFSAVFALAIVAGLSLRDFERGAAGSVALAMGVAAFLILLYVDFKNFPEKGLVPFAVSDVKFPESFKETAARYVKYGTLAAAGIFFFAFMEQRAGLERCFDRERYLAWPRRLKTVYQGNLYFSLLVIEGLLVGFAVLLQLSDHFFHFTHFATMGTLNRWALRWGWLALPLVVLLLPIVVSFVYDLFRAFFSPGLGLPVFAKTWPRSKRFVTVLLARFPRLSSFTPSRAVVAAAAVTAFGLALSLGYYPALAAQISPKEVFDAYERLARPNEPLAMLGRGRAGAASYYAGRDVPTFTSAGPAFEWLTQGEERRWLVIRSSDLPQLNSLYRRRERPPRNLPVLDARSSEILLVSNRLLATEKNQNPFSKWLLESTPQPSRKVDANLGGQLTTLGWDVRTLDGKSAGVVAPGKTYEFVIYYRVDAPISGNWETFVHIDGFKRRYNADHKTLEGKYPLHLWQPGDFIADVHEFALEPNFTPGNYEVFYGLFIASRRLEIKSGSHRDNRIMAGSLTVR